MKTYIITLILFVWTIGVSAQNEEGIQFFHGTWEEALNEAKSQDKMLFVDVWASWCSPCKRMAAETFTQDVVGDYFNKHFVCYKLMIDPKEKTEKEKAEALMKNYQVNAFPTLLWIDCNGDMLHSSVGYKKADELIAEAKIAQNPKKRFSTLLSKWENGDHSLETALKYFSRYSTKSEEFDEYYLHLSPKEQCDTSMQMLLAFQMNLRTDSKIPDYIASHWEDQYKTAPKADFWTMFLRKSLRQQLSEYKNIRQNGVRAINLDDGDELVSAHIATPKTQSVLIATYYGIAIRFPISDLREIGRVSRGVTGIKFKIKNDFVVGAVMIEDDEDKLFSLSELGVGKQTLAKEYRLQSRGGKGIIAMKLTSKTGNMVNVLNFNNANLDLMVLTGNGKMIRVDTDKIRDTSRNTSGVKFITLNEKDKVVHLSQCQKEEKDLEDIANNEDNI